MSLKLSKMRSTVTSCSQRGQKINESFRCEKLSSPLSPSLSEQDSGIFHISDTSILNEALHKMVPVCNRSKMTLVVSKLQYICTRFIGSVIKVNIQIQSFILRCNLCGKITNITGY